MVLIYSLNTSLGRIGTSPDLGTSIAYNLIHRRLCVTSPLWIMGVSARIASSHAQS